MNDGMYEWMLDIRSIALLVCDVGKFMCVWQKVIAEPDESKSMNGWDVVGIYIIESFQYFEDVYDFCFFFLKIFVLLFKKKTTITNSITTNVTLIIVMIIHVVVRELFVFPAIATWNGYWFWGISSLKSFPFMRRTSN